MYEPDSLYRVIDGQWGGTLLHPFLVYHILKNFKNSCISIEGLLFLEESENNLINNLENP